MKQRRKCEHVMTYGTKMCIVCVLEKCFFFCSCTLVFAVTSFWPFIRAVRTCTWSPSPRDCRPAHATSCTPRRITSQLCAMVFFTPGVQHPEVDVSKRYPGFPIPVSPTPRSTGHHVVHLARSVRVCTWPRNLPHLTLGSCDSINSSTSEFFIGSGGKYGCGWVRMSKYPGVV